MKLADLFVEITGRDQKLFAMLDSIKSRVSVWSNATGTMMGNLMTDAFRTAIGSIRGAISDGLSRAMDMEEVLAQFNGTFGKYRQPILNFANEMSRAYGQSKREILEGATDIMRDLTNAGMGKEAAAKKAEEMARMASEMSRKSPGTRVGDNLHDIQAAIVGASRGLRWQGIEFPEQALRRKAIDLFGKSSEYLNSWQEKLVRAEVMADRVRGRLAGMGDGMQRPVGQMEMFWGRWESFVTRLGKAALPAWETAMRVVNRLMEDGSDILEGILNWVNNISTRVAGWIKYLALAKDHWGDVWELFSLGAMSAFEKVRNFASNFFSDLAAFLDDLFRQIADNIGAQIKNGLLSGFNISAQDLLGMGDLHAKPWLKNVLKQAGVDLDAPPSKASAVPVPGIKPHWGLMGDANRNATDTFGEAIRKKMEAIDKVMKDAGFGGIGKPTDEEGRKPEGEPPGSEETTKPTTAQHHDLAQWAKTLQEKILGQNSQAQIADNTKRGADAQVKAADGIAQLNAMLGGATMPGVAV